MIWLLNIVFYGNADFYIKRTLWIQKILQTLQTIGFPERWDSKRREVLEMQFFSLLSSQTIRLVYLIEKSNCIYAFAFQNEMASPCFSKFKLQTGTGALQLLDTLSSFVFTVGALKRAPSPLSKCAFSSPPEPHDPVNPLVRIFPLLSSSCCTGLTAVRLNPTTWLFYVSSSSRSFFHYISWTIVSSTNYYVHHRHNRISKYFFVMGCRA